MVRDWLVRLVKRVQNTAKRHRRLRVRRDRFRRDSIVELLEQRQMLTGITATNDSYSVAMNMGASSPTTLDVLSNDINSSGASGGSGLSIAFVGTVPYGSVSIQAPQGSVAHQTLLFTPTTGYSGTESFTYTATDPAGNTATGTVSVSVNGSYGMSAPQITSLSTHTASTIGGTSEVIYGSGFSGVSAVLAGGTLVSAYSVVSSNQINVTLGSHATGTVDLVVVNSMGSSSTNLNDQVTFQAPAGLPSVSSVSPGTATTSGGATVTITGSSFVGVTAVTFGGVAASSFNVTSPTTISAVTPNHVAGPVDVQVVTASGVSSTNFNDTVIFTTPTLPPSITGLSVNGGTAGSSITVLGSNFNSGTTLSFGSIPATSVVINSSTSLTATIPAGCGSVNVTASNSAGTSNSLVFTYQSSAPSVTGLSQTSGPSTGGEQVGISGTNMTACTGVMVGTIPVTSFVVTSPTSLSVIMPAMTLGTYDITLESGSGVSSVITSADRFTVVTPPPVITGISAATGPITGGTSVVVSGSWLAGATGVTFGGTAASFVVNSNGTITCTSPAVGVTSLSGPVDIIVTTPFGSSAPVNADQFSYSNIAPVVTSLSTVSGSTSGGGSLTISGSHFLGTTAISFGSANVTSYTIANDNTITVVIPAAAAGAAGVVNVTVTNAAGTSPVSSASQFTYTNSSTGNSGSSGGSNSSAGSGSTPGSSGVMTPDIAGVPIVDGLDVNGGTTVGGDTVSIYGVGFTNAQGVYFASQPAQSFTVVSDNMITAITPAFAGTNPSVNVWVSSSAGPSLASGATQFTFTSPTALPSVTGITSAAGSVVPGTLISVQGSNFLGATAVTIGGSAAAYTIQSPTTLQVIVPSGLSGSVNLAVTNANGTSSSTSASQMNISVVTAIPTATATYVVSPASLIPPIPSGLFAGTTGPIAAPNTPPQPPPVQGVIPVQTVNFTSQYNWLVTITENGTYTSSTPVVVPNSDGTGESKIFTITQNVAYVSQQYSNGTLIVYSTYTVKYTLTDTLVEANGTGYTDGSTNSTTSTSEYSAAAGKATYFSNDVYSTSTVNDFGIGPTSLTGTDTATALLIRSNQTVDWCDGFVPAPNTVTNGNFYDASKNSDSFVDSDTNNTLTETLRDRMQGWDKSAGISSGTYALNPDGTRVVADTYYGNASGKDTYNDYQTETPLTPTVTLDPTGTTSILDDSTSTDVGMDEYKFIGSGTIQIALNGTVTDTDKHNDSDDGNEEQTQTDTGWQQSNEVLSDGTVVNFHDNFTDYVNDPSTYGDSDILDAGTASGGTETFSSTANDNNLIFTTTDKVTETDTLTNSYGTPTVAVVTDNTGDSGTASDGSSIGDLETLGAGESVLSDNIKFNNWYTERDTPNEYAKIVVTTIGTVGPGENLNSVETLTDTDFPTQPSTDSYSDPGTDLVLADGSFAESDTSTENVFADDEPHFTDNVISTDTTTNADGSVVEDSVNETDTDNMTVIVGNQAGGDVTVDKHSDVAGTGGAMEVINDDVTNDTSDDLKDNYAQNDNVSETVTVPEVGGSITMSDGASILINPGDAMFEISTGTENDANPANISADFEVDQYDVHNTDKGTATVWDQLNFNLTDPATGVATTITGGDTNTDAFTDDDGTAVTDNTPPGSTTTAASTPATTVTAPPTETVDAHAISGDNFTESSGLTITVLGSPAPGLTIDFLSNPSTFDVGTDSNDDELPPETGGTGEETDTFSESDTDTMSDAGHFYVSTNINTNDGSGNSTVIKDSDNTNFGIGTNSSVTTGDKDSEILDTTAGTVTSDKEGDTYTQVGEIDPYFNETTNASDQIVSVDPATGLRTTMKYVDHGSTDTVTERDIEGFLDVHSASLTNPGSDIDSGSNVLTGSEKTSNDISNEVDVVGTLSTGEVVNIVDVMVLKDGMQDTFTTGDILTTDGTNTDTSGLTGTMTIDDLFHSFSGTIRYTDASTGITTIHNFSDGVEGTSTDTLTEGDTRVIPVAGTATDTPTSSDTGQLHQAWELKEVTSQIDASGNPVGNVTTTSDIGSDTEVEQNGAVTDPGGTNVHLSSTTPATGASPAALAVPSPGDVLNDAESPPPPGASTPPPSVNAIQQQIQQLQIQIQELKKANATLRAEAANVSGVVGWVVLLGAQKNVLARIAEDQADNNALIAQLQDKIDEQRAVLDAADRPRGFWRTNPDDLEDPIDAAADAFLSNLNQRAVPAILAALAMMEVIEGAEITVAAGTVTFVTGWMSTPVTVPAFVFGIGLVADGLDNLYIIHHNYLHPDDPTTGAKGAILAWLKIDPNAAWFFFVPTGIRINRGTTAPNGTPPVTTPGSAGSASIADDFTFSSARQYELNPKHGTIPRYEGNVYIGKRPTNPTTVLEDSIPLGGTSRKRRIGYDSETKEIVVFDRDRDWWSRADDGQPIQLGGTWHGHVRPWEMLDLEMKQTLIKGGLFNRRGKYIGE